jgi:predicted phosphodiesterase
MAWPVGKPNIAKQKISDEKLIEEITKHGVRPTARKYGMEYSSVHQRRRKIERRDGIAIKSPRMNGGFVQELDRHPAAVHFDILDGHILVGSDSHYYPGIVSAAHRAFLEFAREFNPKLIVKNGDELDFPTISRFAHGWEKRPTVAEELEYANAMLGEIEKSAPNARLAWPVGNHDSRLETRIATSAPELAQMKGVHLRDHFNPRWEPCFAVFVNNDVVIKHRIKGGIYAPRNNTLLGGKTVITGHLHSQKVWPHTDYQGTRWGVDAGTMADPYGPQFYGYTELSPLDWRSGFCLLTFVKGKLLMPELIWVSGKDTVQFRGREWTV